MKAAVFHGPGDIRIDDVPDPRIEQPTDAIVRITHTAICGSDLWFYRGQQDYGIGSRTGHEPTGIVEEVGKAVRHIKRGGCWAMGTDGAQGEAVRAPFADATLARAPDNAANDEQLLEALFPLTDVMGTGHHAAVCAGVGLGSTAVTVGDGAVGPCAVLAAKRLGAARIIAVTRPGGALGHVGVPHGPAEEGLDIVPMCIRNVTLRGGPAPVRAYMDELMGDVLAGKLDPSPVLDMMVDLQGVPGGYEAMNKRTALRVLVRH